MKLKPSLTAPAFVMVVYAFLFASRYIDTSRFGNGSAVYLSIIVLQLIVFILPGIFYCRIKGIRNTGSLNLKLFSPGMIGFVILAVATLITGSTLIRFAQVYLSDIRDFNFIEYQGYTMSAGSTELDNPLFLLLTFALVPAMAEEFVFRGILICEYNDGGYSTGITVFVTSLLFAMLHFSMDQFPVYLLGGLTFAFVTYVTQSSLAAMIAHFIYNLYGLFGEKYVMAVIRKPENLVFFIFAVATLFIIFMILTLGEAERIYFRNASFGFDTPAYVKNRKNNTASAKFKSTAEVLLSPTFLFCILFFAVITFGFI